MRIFLADDQAKARSALRLLLEQEPGLSVVGEATETEDLLAQVQRTQPDLVLLDWELPGLWATDLSTAPSASPWSSDPGTEGLRATFVVCPALPRLSPEGDRPQWTSGSLRRGPGRRG